MTPLLGILSLLLALAVTGDALSCRQCSSFTSTCTGSSVACPAGSLCGSTYTETSVGGSTSAQSLIMTCTPSSQCHFNGSLSMLQGRVRMVTSCCSTDNCVPTIPALPAIGSNPNGLVCRSCVSASSTWCYTSDTVQCTGDENMCLLQTTEIKGTLSTAIRGCTTKSLCDLGSQSQTIQGVTTNVKFICTSGGLSIHKVILTPAIVCLLLLKFFF
ncbi:phospholipase A2 inhibitor and Ly6/PLAUR domain-containing protein-like [Leptodactylus fuscus]|uniref:phospholipase A2 inhibitor and Ly6/PLAUR domain-containing protein-like n=1 Tax=Leptodactylus fuscus TaxID=238119 RepID=UPI003F4E971C